MSDLAISRRYALALYQEASASQTVEAVDQAVDDLQTTLAGARDLQLLLRNPVIPTAKKEAVLTSLFQGMLHPQVLGLTSLLLRKKRGAVLPAVLESYQALRDAARGEVIADVRTALPLADAQAAALKQTLEARTGLKVRLSTTVEPDLIGGLVVRIGDRVFDSSVRNQLSVLHSHFAHRAAVSAN